MLKPSDFKTLREYDEYCVKKFNKDTRLKNIISKEKENKKNKIKQGRIKASKRLKYKTYISSSEWKKFKKLIISERGMFCEFCDREMEYLELHHITYKNLFKELRGDVLLLCITCHRKMHKRLKKPPYSLENLKSKS